MTRLVCLALALATLAACDSAGPTNTPPTLPPPTQPPGGTPGPAPSITFTPPAGEISGDEDGAEVVFALRSLFATTGDVGSVAYTTATSNGAVASRIDGDSLRIALVSAGVSLVKVEATGGALVATGSFSVRSIGRCPAEIAAGQIALLPDLAEGAEWRFTLTGDERPTGSPWYRTKGTAALVFGASTCSDGARTQPVTETTSIQSSRRNPMTGEYDPYGDPREEMKQYVWTTTATETRTTSVSLPVRNQKTIPPFGPRIPRSVEASAFAAGAYIDDQGGGSSFGPRVTFTPQSSLTSFSATTNYGTPGQGQLTWQRTLP